MESSPMQHSGDPWSDLPPAAREEISFWEAALQLQGQHAEDFRCRLPESERHRVYLAALLNPLVSIVRERFHIEGPVACLELGSGPISVLAAGVDTGQLDVTALDVLADQYAVLSQRYRFEDYPVQPVRGSGEGLFEVVREGSAYVTFVSNALDHVDDLPHVFDNLLRARVRGGFLVLLHFPEEGSSQDWSAAHKWNLNLDRRGLAATNAEGHRFELGARDDVALRFLSYRDLLEQRAIDVVYERLQAGWHQLSSGREKQREPGAPSATWPEVRERYSSKYE